MRTLYHYTTLRNAERIIADGVIRTTDSRLSPTMEHAGPDVVWLTTDGECKYRHGLAADEPLDLALDPDEWDKTRVRFAVRLPTRRVQRWREWALLKQIDPQHLRTMVRSAGGGANTWRVTEHQILQDRWIEVVDRVTGEHLFTPRGRRDIAC